MESVISQPRNGTLHGVPFENYSLVLNMASAADSVMPWGLSPRQRDIQLRQFWPTENYLASAIYTAVSKYAGYGWTLEGPPRTVAAVQDTLQSSERGKGWVPLMSKFVLDLLTQDNGAFIEVVRQEDSPTSPVLSLNHLDSGRCYRTGRWEEPVIYQDIDGRFHALKWYQVIEHTEMPSPIEQARGLQYCAVTRILRAAQILRDISVLKNEKAAGRFTRAIHLVSGVQTRAIEDAIKTNHIAADAQGLVRYIQPVVLAALDPTAKVSKETIELASLPDDFNEELTMKWYVVSLAMALGQDYQDFAPLPGGGLGSGSESKTLLLKSRGKGPRMFMQQLQHVFNFHGIMPRSVEFRFGEQDLAEEHERAVLRKERAVEREIRIRSGEITPEVARQMAVDAGDLDPRYLVMMREENATDEITVTSTERADRTEDDDVKPGEAAPKTLADLKGPAPTAAGNGPQRPENSNDKIAKAPSQSQKVNPGGVA